jgi:hypothetical protein
VQVGIPASGHPLANGAATGFAERGGVFFKAGRIDAQILCGPEVLRTSDAEDVRCGLAQVRRVVAGERVRAVHVVFAPEVRRPLLLGLVRLRNADVEARIFEYTEMWQVGGGAYATGSGAAELATASGRRVLAEAASAIRARAPEDPPSGGLALGLRVPVPAGAVRELAFAYAAPEADDDPGALIRAFRGQVRAELVRVARRWAGVVDPADPVSDYRKRAATLGACGR